MCKNIAPEYLITLSLIKATKENPIIDSLPYWKIRELSRALQNYCNENNIDIVVHDWKLNEAEYYYPEYFETLKLNGEAFIKCKTTASFLKNKFLGNFYICVGIEHCTEVMRFILNDFHWKN